MMDMKGKIMATKVSIVSLGCAKNQVDAEMMANANPKAIFMHCLPAFHDTETEYGKEIKEKYGLTEMEVTDEVFRSKYARQFEEAENRMHSIKAIMAATLGNLFIPAVPEDFK